VAAFFVAGDLNLDTTTVVPAPAPSGKETQARIALSFGGQGGNVAFFLHCLGEPVRLFGMLGNDPAGDLYLEHLARLGIAYAGGRTDQLPTGMVSVVQQGDAYHMYRQRGANNAIPAESLERALRDALAGEAAVVFISGYTLLDKGCREALAAAAASAGRRQVIAMDPASIDAMSVIGRPGVLGAARVCTYLLPNEEEACWLAREQDAEAAARALHHLTGAIIALKLGARGALLCAGDTVTHMQGVPVEALDVTGAGDSFSAAFLSAHAHGLSDADALRRAVLFSSRKVQFAGTQPAEMAITPSGTERP